VKAALSFSTVAEQSRQMTLLLALCLSATSPHVLLIGIDGMRTDSLPHAPNITALMDKGTFSKQVSLNPLGDTISAPGWTTLLTGKTDHGVMGNADLYAPDFWTKRKPVFWDSIHGRRVSIFDWPGMARIVGPVGESFFVDRETASGTMERRRDVNADAVVVAEAAQELEGAVDFLFVHMTQVDTAGHVYGFESAEYLKAVSRVDAHVGTLVKAVDDRPTWRSERWLVAVATDHGGHGDGHSKGHGDPLVDNVWLLLFGDGVPHKDLGHVSQTYLAPAVLEWWQRQ
jgi:predicted AlkP superfamily pyrophosphatase or phosphodiesterase